MERMGNRQLDQSVSLEIESGSCRLKAGKGEDGADGTYTDGSSCESRDWEGELQNEGGERDGGVAHVDGTHVGNATDDHTYRRPPRMCMGGQVKYNCNDWE